MRLLKQTMLLVFLLLSINKIFAQDSLRFSHNPFRDSTLISFDISSAAKISIIAYNNVGQKVDSFYKDTFLQIGSHSFYFGAGIPEGFYIVIYKIYSKSKVYQIIKSQQNLKINNLHQQKSILIFPNPSQGNSNILVENLISKAVSIYIYDPAGRLVYTAIIFDSSMKLDISKFENGLYTLCIPDLGYSTQLVLMR